MRRSNAGGARFISLAAIRDPTLIVPTLTQGLGLTESPDRLFLESLKEFLRERQMLLVEVAQLAISLETAMGYPVDVECAYAGGQLYLLQCHPITALVDKPLVDKPLV